MLFRANRRRCQGIDVASLIGQDIDDGRRDHLSERRQRTMV